MFPELLIPGACFFSSIKIDGVSAFSTVCHLPTPGLYVGGKGSLCYWTCSCRVLHTGNNPYGLFCQPQEHGRSGAENSGCKVHLSDRLPACSRACYWEYREVSIGAAWGQEGTGEDSSSGSSSQRSSRRHFWNSCGRHRVPEKDGEYLSPHTRARWRAP